MQTKRCLVFILVSLLLIAGCSEKIASEKTCEKIVLRWSTWGSPDLLALWKKLVDLYEKDHLNIKVRLETSPYAEYNRKLLTRMAGKTAPDVMWIDNKYFFDFARRNVFLDLKPFIEKDKFDTSDFYQKIFTIYSYKGKQYGIPSDFSVFVMFYNRDLFDEEEIGYPDKSWTWDNFLEAARKLTKDTNDDGRIDQYGCFTPGGYTGWMSLIWQNGGEIFDKDRIKCLLDSPKAKEAIQFIPDLIFKYKVAPSPTITASYGSEQLWQTNKIGMFFSWCSLETALNKKKLSQWGMAPLPKGKERATIYGECAYCVSKDTRYPEESWELVKFLSSDLAQRLATEAGNIIPARKSVADSNIYLKPEGKISKDRQACLDSLEYAHPIPVVAKWDEIWSTINMELQLVFLGKKSVREACEIVTPKVDKLLGKY